MATVVIGAVINIVLDPIFIFGFHMGVKGAALATILSQAVSAIWVLRFLTGKKTILKLQKKYFRLRGSVVGPCLLLGMSPFIMPGNGKRHQRLLQFLSVSLRRGYCRRRHEYFDQHHAVFHAAPPGLYPGGTAHYRV